MRLCEHPDFVQAILRASDHFRSRGLRPALVEKDYCVTEALRLIAGAVGSQVIFKGGTSLSKGWNLIQRFSEDIDIFLDPRAFAPELRGRAVDRELKHLRDTVALPRSFSRVAPRPLRLPSCARTISSTTALSPHPACAP